MSDTTTRMANTATVTTTTNEATFLGGILRKGEVIEGWSIESKIPVASGEAELYIAYNEDKMGVVKYYRQNFTPKQEILETLIQWKHPDVINLLAYGQHNGLFYEIMEYAAGGALDTKNSDGSYKYLPLEEFEVQKMICELTEAFSVCHQAGIIHRDIKPANVYYRNEDGTDFVIGDFGISSQLDTGINASKRMTNTSRTDGYAAPEVYSGYLGEEVDWYALGILVWEVLTGVSPFEGWNPQSISAATIAGTIPDDLLSREESRNISPSLVTLIKGLLTHRSDKRWKESEVRDWIAGKEVAVFGGRVEVQVRPYSFEGKMYDTLPGLSMALLENPEAGKKNLYRGLIEGWIAGFDQNLAMQVGDLREEAGDGEQAKIKALRRVALLLDPGNPFRCEDGTELVSLMDLKKVLEGQPESIVDHLRNPDDSLWDYLSVWGAGAALVHLQGLLLHVKSQKRLTNQVLVALSGNIIKPFENSRFTGTELSTLSQLSTLPKELQKRIVMDLEDSNGLLAVWLEAVSGREYPESWKKEGIPVWIDLLNYWKTGIDSVLENNRRTIEAEEQRERERQEEKLKIDANRIKNDKDEKQQEDKSAQNYSKSRPEKKKSRSMIRVLLFFCLCIGSIFGIQRTYIYFKTVAEKRASELANKPFVYKIGDLGPGGGIVFYDKGAYSDGWRYLECSKQFSAETYWADGSGYITGLKSDLGDGLYNTINIINFLGDQTAASKAANYNSGGVLDWYLGNNIEMTTLYKNIEKNSKNRKKAMKQDGFERFRYGYFFNNGPSSCWTSEMINATEAYYINLGHDRGTISNTKITSYEMWGMTLQTSNTVRPIRRF